MLMNGVRVKLVNMMLNGVRVIQKFLELIDGRSPPRESIAHCDPRPHQHRTT